MRSGLALIVLGVALGGCAAYTERQSLGAGDYAGFSCDQLGEEALRLFRQAAGRSEHLLENDGALRDAAMGRLKLVKQASAEKGC